MKKSNIMLLGTILLLSMFTLWGCPKSMTEETIGQEAKEPVQEAAAPAPAPAPAPEPVKEEPKPAPVPEPVKEEVKETAPAAAAGMQPIYFDFDKSYIRDDAKPVMKANAEWLKANPKMKVRIEGNCDEIGTKEYNQALGQRRATSAKKYLTDLGIAAKRISLISYGKEKPICTEAAEDCYQKNRRDDLVAVSD